MNIRRRKPPKPRGTAEKLLRGGEVTIGGRQVEGSRLTQVVLAAVVLVGAIGWWLWGREFYSEVEADSVTIAGNAYPVTEYRGIEAAGEPGLMRACFRIRDQIFAPPASNPAPKGAPGWFKCFRPERIVEELAAGKAKVYLAEYNNPPGYDTLVVVFESERDSNLRGFMWRQPNENLR